MLEKQSLPLKRESSLSAQIAFFQEALLSWWEQNKRSFPWRSNCTPYRAIIAEILLRKTTAQQASSVFQQLTALYPNPCNLSKATEVALEKLLHPLGMYRERARLLKLLGEKLCERFGSEIKAEDLTADRLKGLPGVGPYVQNMVLAVCRGEALPGLDRNFIRFISRYFGVRSSRSRAHMDPELWKFAAKLIPPGKGRELNWAVMDLAGLICRPNPHCERCPLQEKCLFFQKNLLSLD
ncbi:hypothetical protein [Thermus sp. 93170]|uniref:hypothetical protein n=1 Tax=Thermus sp. 93170 TaxID=1046939 RepID=UPI003F428FA5